MRSTPDGSGKNEPAYKRLAASIRSAILAGELKVGQRLPSESGMAGEAGVSRSTVRESLRVLQESGFIERSSPRIFVVRERNEGPTARAVVHALQRRTVTFAALHESLLLLEPELARLAALRRDDEDLAKLQENLRLQRRQSKNPQKWCRLGEEFHIAIAEASANAPLVLARVTLGLVLLPTISKFATSVDVTSMGIDFHQRTYDAIAEGDPDIAALIVRRQVEDFAKDWERSGLEYDLDISELIDETTARLHL